jgi:Flp pilus assembly protein TadG
LARRAERDQRGSNLVEAAIILPVIVLLTFGAIDFGIGFNQKAGLDSAGRAGVRLGATDTIADNATATVTANGTIAANTQIGFDAGQAVNAAFSQVESKPQLINMYVFRSTFNVGTGTWTPSSVTSAAQCGTDCIQYSPRATDRTQFDLYNTGSVGTWPAGTNFSERSACTLNADRVGITIIADYRFLTGLVGSTVRLTSTSAAQLEPTNC